MFQIYQVSGSDKGFKSDLFECYLSYLGNNSMRGDSGGRLGILAHSTRNYPFVSINRFFSEQSRAERRGKEKKEPNEGRNGGLLLIALL